ncbi:hypothetical protein GIB67_032810 [Kingdonia uniflora]|uniref:Uncharacterized protein n=1 Tax=Kingdonia uniflora TaxID=39325 RepID=A0A7J7MWD2_9MAGN|nr:hypothetical protein GIB67_032810 [Kingdonia uniflora]
MLTAFLDFQAPEFFAAYPQENQTGEYSCRIVCGVLVGIEDQLSDELLAQLEIRGTNNAKELLEQLQFFHIVASLSLA